MCKPLFASPSFRHMCIMWSTDSCVLIINLSQYHLFKFWLRRRSRVISEKMWSSGQMLDRGTISGAAFGSKHTFVVSCSPAAASPTRIHWHNNKRTFSGAFPLLAEMIKALNNRQLLQNVSTWLKAHVKSTCHSRKRTRARCVVFNSVVQKIPQTILFQAGEEWR